MNKLSDKQREKLIHKIYEETYKQQMKIFKKLWIAYYTNCEAGDWVDTLQSNKIKIEIGENEKGDKILRISNKWID